MYTSPVIYKRDSNGGLRTWQFGLEGSRWCTIAGGPGRKPVTSGWTQCRGKQGRDDEAQAVFEANAACDQKLSREYRRTEAELDAVPKGPMLAHKWGDYPVAFPVFSQPKLDGIRSIHSVHGAFSREYQPHLNVGHITAALAPIFEAHPGIVFDGELYNHDFKDNFGKISSIVRKQNPTEEQRVEAARYLQYHIYDIADDSLPFADRTALMYDLFPPGDGPIQRVPTLEIENAEALDGAYGVFINDGYEGQMVRTNMPYEFDRRSKTLLKRKEFITAEFKLKRIEEGQGNWAGYAKRVVFELPDGRECGAGVRGTQAQMKELIGLACSTASFKPEALVTIRHFTPTPDGMPRFPVAIDFHFGGRKD